MTEDIEYCIHWECSNKKCERHPSGIRQKELDHSFMDLRGVLCKDWKTAEKFGWKCPYNGMRCNIWNCTECEQEKWEEEWVKGKQEEESADAKWQKRIEEIKADILRYKSDCGVTAFGSPRCERCNENMFGSILRIIDKHTKGDT